MGQKNDCVGKYQKPNNKSLKVDTLKIAREDYIKFFKGICRIIHDYNAVIKEVRRKRKKK